MQGLETSGALQGADQFGLQGVLALWQPGAEK
jgi:hypothetical protein